jgi:hypothetical protein
MITLDGLYFETPPIWRGRFLCFLPQEQDSRVQLPGIEFDSFIYYYNVRASVAHIIELAGEIQNILTARIHGNEIAFRLSSNGCTSHYSLL